MARSISYPDKSVDTIVITFINEYLPVHMYPWYILSDNGTEFENSLMDQVLQQLGIDRIFSAPYHPQSNGKLEVFHKYLKSTLKKLCEKDPANWDMYLNQVLTSYRITPNIATAEPTFFLVYGRHPNQPLHQLLEPMQHFLGDPASGKLNLETHRLALVIAKKTLDENRFTATQKTLARNQPAFQIGFECTLRINNLEMGFKKETWLQNCLHWAQRTPHPHREPRHRKNTILQHQRHHPRTPIEFWNIDTQFGRASHYINHPANLPTIQLMDTS